jgi:hypothetical protein
VIPETRDPMIAECVRCGHCWPCAYLPLPMRDLLVLLRRATCPSCAATAEKLLASEPLAPAGRRHATLRTLELPMPHTREPS